MSLVKCKKNLEQTLSSLTLEFTKDFRMITALSHPIIGDRPRGFVRIEDTCKKIVGYLLKHTEKSLAIHFSHEKCEHSTAKVPNEKSCQEEILSAKDAHQKGMPKPTKAREVHFSSRRVAHKRAGTYHNLDYPERPVSTLVDLQAVAIGTNEQMPPTAAFRTSEKVVPSGLLKKVPTISNNVSVCESDVHRASFLQSLRGLKRQSHRNSGKCFADSNAVSLGTPPDSGRGVGIRSHQPTHRAQSERALFSDEKQQKQEQRTCSMRSVHRESAVSRRFRAAPASRRSESVIAERCISAGRTQSTRNLSQAHPRESRVTKQASRETSVLVNECVLAIDGANHGCDRVSMPSTQARRHSADHNDGAFFSKDLKKLAMTTSQSNDVLSDRFNHTLPFEERKVPSIAAQDGICGQPEDTFLNSGSQPQQCNADVVVADSAPAGEDVVDRIIMDMRRTLDEFALNHAGPQTAKIVAHMHQALIQVAEHERSGVYDSRMEDSLASWTRSFLVVKKDHLHHNHNSI